jgi:hypothetical protein
MQKPVQDTSPSASANASVDPQGTPGDSDALRKQLMEAVAAGGGNLSAETFSAIQRNLMGSGASVSSAPAPPAPVQQNPPAGQFSFVEQLQRQLLQQQQANRMADTGLTVAMPGAAQQPGLQQQPQPPPSQQPQQAAPNANILEHLQRQFAMQGGNPDLQQLLQRMGGGQGGSGQASS